MVFFSAFLCFRGERELVRVHMTRQTGKLARVPRVLKEDHVVSIQVDSSNVLILVKKVLHEKCHADVAVMQTFGKQVGDRASGFVHKVVHDKQYWLSAVKVVHVRQSLRYARIHAKQLLIFAVIVDDATKRKIDHDTRIFDQFKYETRFTATRWPCYECRERMTQRQGHNYIAEEGVDERCRRRRKSRKKARSALSELTNYVSATQTIFLLLLLIVNEALEVPLDIVMQLKSRLSEFVLFIISSLYSLSSSKPL